MGDVIRYAIHYHDRLDAKSKPSYSERMVVVEDIGMNKYLVQQYSEKDAEVVECHADDMRLEKLFPQTVRCDALAQAAEALTLLTEHEIEDVRDERGVIARGTEEYLIKWVGHPICTWEPTGSSDNNCQPLDTYKAS